MIQFGRHQTDKIRDVITHSYFQREIINIALRKKWSCQTLKSEGVTPWKLDLDTEHDGFEGKVRSPKLTYDIAPENRPSQKQTSIPTIHFHVLC